MNNTQPTYRIPALRNMAKVYEFPAQPNFLTWEQAQEEMALKELREKTRPNF